MPGMSTSSLCPKRGFVWLKTHLGQTLVMPTTCKTWGCSGCRDRLMALFTMRVEVGVLALKRCAFITLTYRTTGTQRMDASSAASDWKELWRRLRKNHPKLGSLKWLRVVELTKAGQPHFHVVLGPVAGRVRCYGSEGLEVGSFRRRMESCDCLAHVVSRVWFGVTGDSWVVDATPVVGPGGAGGYLAKYMRKGSLNRGGLERLGFLRRWSSSHGWPGSGRLRLRQTLEGGWQSSHFSRSGFGRDTVVLGSGLTPVWPTAADPANRLLERVGNDLALVLAEKRSSKASLAYLMKVLKDDTNVPAPPRSA